MSDLAGIFKEARGKVYPQAPDDIYGQTAVKLANQIFDWGIEILAPQTVDLPSGQNAYTGTISAAETFLNDNHPDWAKKYVSECLTNFKRTFAVYTPDDAFTSVLTASDKDHRPPQRVLH